MNKLSKRHLLSCSVSYSILSNLASNNRMNFCRVTRGRHMETNRSMSRQPWVLSKIASMILIAPLYVLVHLSAERNVLLMLQERSTNLYSKMVPSATQANQRMCGLTVELRSDSGTKTKAQTPDPSEWVRCTRKCVLFFLCIELNISMRMQICSNNSLIWKEKWL